MDEKRRSQRRASLTRCRVDRLFSREKPFAARVINFSENGLMLEQDYPLRPGDPLTVLFEPDAPEVPILGSSTCIGMVRWCVQQEGNVGALYGVGVELARRCLHPTVT